VLPLRAAGLTAYDPEFNPDGGMVAVVLDLVQMLFSLATSSA